MNSSEKEQNSLVAYNLWSLNNLWELILFQINVTILKAFANFSISEINNEIKYNNGSFFYPISVVFFYIRSTYVIFINLMLSYG